jgi:hypothetical protein
MLTLNLKESAVVRARDEAERLGKNYAWAAHRAGELYGRRVPVSTYYYILNRLFMRLTRSAA